jgi:hypothetical protein
MAEFYHERRPRSVKDGDDSLALTKQTVTAANDHILGAVPDYRHAEIDRRIKTAAVQRHRARASGVGDFSSISEYKNFIYGQAE